MIAPTVLIIDIDRHSVDALRALIEESGATAQAVFHPDDLAGIDLATRFDLLMVAPSFSLLGGLPPLDYLHMVAPDKRVVPLLAAHEAVPPGFAESALLRKPYQRAALQHLLADVSADADTFFGIVGQSVPMRNLFDIVRDVAATDAPLLIEGETGVGKELVARAAHQLSHRRFMPMVTLNCGALSDTLLSAELFGYERGAFTGAVRSVMGKFEHAHRGTLFLDEIGEISPSAQIKLLKVLESGEVERLGARKVTHTDVRLIFATNRKLEKEVAAGRFRSDLFYRINVFPLRVPPLRERPDDIPLLVRHFIFAAAKKYEKEVPFITSHSMAALQQRRWQGNVRELFSVIERAVIRWRGGPLDCEEETGTATAPMSAVALASLSYRQLKRDVLSQTERHYFEALLAATGSNVSQAAKRAGLDRKTFYTKLAACGIDISRQRRREP